MRKAARSPLALLVALAAGCNQGVYSDVTTDSDTETDATTEAGTTAPDVPDPDPAASDPAGPPITLRLDDTAPSSLTLAVDKSAALTIFAEQSKYIDLLTIDAEPMLTNALDTLRAACGWSPQNPSGKLDCSGAEAKALGFPDAWQTSPEYALVRLLTLTPDNANLEGTSLGTLQGFANDNPQIFPTGFAGALADSLGGIDLDDSLLPLPAMIRAIEMSLLASHPNVDNSEGLISVTLYDALHDMTPLQEKLGAIGEHPGVLLRDDIDNPDGFVTKSDALTDQFKMVMTISSRHRRVDGVDLSAASGGDMFIVQGDPALDFHLNDIEISGLADPPTIDMRLRIEEVTTPIEPCDDGPSCYDNAPPEQAFTGIWTEDPWNFEYFAALAGWLHYGVENPLRYYTCYAFYQGQCAATVALGHAQNAGAEIDPAAPDGWASFILTDPPFSPTLIATLPPQQYFWEMLVGIADTMYHDPNGDGVPDYETAVPQFTFHGLDIGVSTQELVDKVVESLKAQEEKLATVLVGEFWRNNDPLDFYYWRGEDGRPYLYFANEEDLRPDPQDPNKQLVPSYPTPGFYSCPEFSGCKVSQTTVLGVDDKTHEKVRLVDTQTILYVRDDQNDPYEVQFTVANDAEIFVRVTPL